MKMDSCFSYNQETYVPIITYSPRSSQGTIKRWQGQVIFVEMSVKKLAPPIFLRSSQRKLPGPEALVDMMEPPLLTEKPSY